MAMAATAAASLGCSRDVSSAAAIRGRATPLELSKSRIGLRSTISRHSRSVKACVSATTTTAPTFDQPRTTLGGKNIVERQTCRLALPSKGRMAEGTLNLLKDCSLPVRKLNPRQYIADIPGLKDLEVWFQREGDVVRKLRSGDVDMGIVGYDVVAEFGEDDPDIVLVHDALEFGECHLGIAVPTYGIFESINTFDELAAMPQWTKERPLRIVTGFTYLGTKFLKEKGLQHVELSTADGALEAGPAMGTADAILDLVSSGTTLRENNLKELEGGRVISSQGVFIASKKALLNRPGVFEAAHELLERFEANLRARGQFTKYLDYFAWRISIKNHILILDRKVGDLYFVNNLNQVVANMRGESAQEVADKLFQLTNNHGLQGPTISPVYVNEGGKCVVKYYAIVICVAKPDIFRAVRELRRAGGSGVLVSPLTYIFDEEPVRWRSLLDALNMAEK